MKISDFDKKPFQLGIFNLKECAVRIIMFINSSVLSIVSFGCCVNNIAAVPFLIYVFLLFSRIVRAYLQHYGYEETLKQFDMASRSTVPPIPLVQETRCNEVDTKYAINQRRILRQVCHVKTCCLVFLYS